MLSEKLHQAINKQINAEFWSANLYLSMSAWFADKGLPGFSHWMKEQFKEEQEHAMRFFNYLVSRGAKVEIGAYAAVPVDWKDAKKVFEDTLHHEQVVTGMINDLYTLALEEKDYATQSMLKWFIDEQVEEEDTARGILDALCHIKDNSFGLYRLDKEMGERQG
ncbi:MAG: ferritin [Bacteroidales bacterium]|jgi:ferritin|nr:ferritin [Bacteroidales bacterium]MDI9544515.1 ferritin [Bacteroidota bacterium]MBP8983040.1 ferritin [Bacteroidales bacterium]NLV39238.1 ferritin [Bacteroidales bacterium]HNZ81173.1 ferritin [Bacteroidales bacterium]